MAWTDTVHKFLAHLTHNTTLPTYTDGQTAEAQSDSRGRLIVSVGATSVPTSGTVSTTWYDCITATHKATIVGSAKSLLFAQFQSTYGVAGWIQIHNLAAHTSLSTGVTVPTMVSIPIAANGTVSIDLPRGRTMSNGLVWAFSSTPSVWTQDAAATVMASVEYI
jgi:hypothetical protein